MKMVLSEIDTTLVRQLIRPRSADGHKGTFGHVLLVAGSEGKAGAALLAAEAAMRTGCGLTTVCMSSGLAVPLLCRLPEAMLLPRTEKSTTIDTARFQSIGFGPGAGVQEHTATLLHDLLDLYRQPFVIDADGITVLAQNRSWYQRLGAHVILTPHPKEFDRLTTDHKTDEDRLAAQLAFSHQYQVTIVLKGHRSTVTLPSGEVFRNTTGNSGMGTAGSGDVLTGIIASLGAQGYSCKEAALLGVFLHGFAGDQAAAALSATSMIASDIVRYIPQFFWAFERTDPG